MSHLLKTPLERPRYDLVSRQTLTEVFKLVPAQKRMSTVEISLAQTEHHYKVI